MRLRLFIHHLITHPDTTRRMNTRNSFIMSNSMWRFTLKWLFFVFREKRLEFSSKPTNFKWSIRSEWLKAFGSFTIYSCRKKYMNPFGINWFSVIIYSLVWSNLYLSHNNKHNVLKMIICKLRLFTYKSLNIHILEGKFLLVVNSCLSSSSVSGIWTVSLSRTASGQTQ